MTKVDMSVNLAGVTMKNPVVVASGTFGFGREYGQFYDLSELGGICVKGLTAQRREGNPAPRIAETPMGILNSVGLQNPGVDAFIETELPFLRQYDVKVIANISGNTPEEYGVMCEKLSAAGVDMIEVNISCPNVKAGGLAYGTKPELAAEVTETAKRHAVGARDGEAVPQRHRHHRDRPGGGGRGGGRSVPHQHPARHAHRREHPAPGAEDEHRRPVRPRRAAGGGADGLGGGPAPSSCPSWAWAASPKGEDAAQLMLAGASAVAVGTALFADPFAPIKVRDGLEAIAERKGLDRVSGLTGGVKVW